MQITQYFYILIFILSTTAGVFKGFTIVITEQLYTYNLNDRL